MGTALKPLLFSSILISQFLSSFSQSCTNYSFTSNKTFSSCIDLPYLNSFLHYTYNPSPQNIEIAYRRTKIDSSRWVAWAINPTSNGMVGSQSLVAYQKSDGTMRVYKAPINGYQTTLDEGDLSFPVSELSTTFLNGEIIIFATLGIQNISTSFNQVWQDGPVSSDVPGRHDVTGANIQSMGTLNLLSGNSGGGKNLETTKRNIHGVVNTVSWGIMMPLGALIARYLKVFKSADPAWFYLHVTCQTSAYIIGIAGFATGLHLGSQSPGIQYTPHRFIGILLFCLGTLQVFALLLRPQKDQKYRFYWNIYHHSVGYTVIILSIVNIFKGFHILNPQKKWENAYIASVVVLATSAASLEAYTWYIVVKRKKEALEEQKRPHGMQRTNGFSVYGARTNGRV